MRVRRKRAARFRIRSSVLRWLMPSGVRSAGNELSLHREAIGGAAAMRGGCNSHDALRWLALRQDAPACAQHSDAGHKGPRVAPSDRALSLQPGQDLNLLRYLPASDESVLSERIARDLKERLVLEGPEQIRDLVRGPGRQTAHRESAGQRIRDAAVERVQPDQLANA